MATTDFIAAIELGSSHIAGIAGTKNNDGGMKVLAYVQEESSACIRKGIIYNLDKTSLCIKKVVAQLEEQLDCSVSRVYVGIGGQSLRTVLNKVTRDLQEECIISEEIVDSMSDENRSVPIVDMDILEVVPQEYRLGNNLQTDPVGIATSHIEGRYLNLVARSTLKKNLERCFEQAQVTVADLFISPLITANAILTESERRSGCALVDFGADTTTISVYKNNLLRYLNVLPLGGHSITRDITSLQIEEEEAEVLKQQYGDVMYEEPEDETDDPAVCYTSDETVTIRLKDLNEIISARQEEILANVWNLLQLSGYHDKLLAGIVLTGGASNMRHLSDLFRKIAKVEKVRIAKVVRQSVEDGLGIVRKDGTQNTLFGLLLAGKENCGAAKQARPEPSVAPQPEPAKETFVKQEDENNTFVFQETEEKDSPDMQPDIFSEDQELNRMKEENLRKKKEEKKNNARKQANTPKKPGFFGKMMGTLADTFFEKDNDDDKF